MARRDVAPARDQQTEAVAVHAHQHLRGRQRPDPGGGQLEGERDAFQTRDQRGNRFGIARRDLKIGTHGLRPVHE